MSSFIKTTKMMNPEAEAEKESTPDSPPVLSCIVPCHNPREDYLRRTLEALKKQTLPCSEWELVVVDNASSPPLSEWVDISWHPGGRIVVETTPGLTHARLCGFRETTAELILMVDDDNVLDPSYLKTACGLARKLPSLGVFGGSIEACFDTPPPKWTRSHLSCVAIWPCAKSVWSNDINHWESTPSGAGMCVRRSVAERYTGEVANHPLRKALDRCGDSLVSGGDTDIAWTACSMGLGMGRFRELRLDHLIPPERLTADYFARMYEGKGYSDLVLNTLWRRHDPVSEYEGFVNLARAGLKRFIRDTRNRRFLKAKYRGEARARSRLNSIPEKEIHPPSAKG